jgi:hypothetical protein
VALLRSKPKLCTDLPAAAACDLMPQWALSRERQFTALRFAPRRAMRPTGSPVWPGINACLGTRARPSRPRRWVTRSMPDICTLRSAALGCDTHQTVALNIVRRPKTTPIHELERYVRCKDCSQVRGYPYKRSHLVALRATKISANDPPSTWWPGER